MTYYVMLDHEQTAGEHPTIEAARVQARSILAKEPLCMNVSIYDDEGECVEDLGLTFEPNGQPYRSVSAPIDAGDGVPVQSED